MQVLSPATILAVDLAALTLLDLPCLVAVILGVLAEEFGWIAKSFPQAFGVRALNVPYQLLLPCLPCWPSVTYHSLLAGAGVWGMPLFVASCDWLCCAVIDVQLVLKMEQALSSATPAPAAEPAPAPTPDAPANSPGQAAPPPAAAQRLPWPEDQPLPLAELLSILYWLQQHAVRLQLAPGAGADLYMDPDLEVYAAVRVPALSMQSRPTLIGGEGSQQRQGKHFPHH
jgi:hypothetical protein